MLNLISVIQDMNINDVDLNLLRTFETVYSTKSISRAAEQLDMSQPALSNALARLRQQMGDHLFTRSGSGVAPTARAEAMIGPVRDSLRLLQKGIAPETSFDVSTSERDFKLIIAEPVEPIIVPSLLRALGKDGRASVELIPPQSTSIEEALLNGRAELAVFLPPARFPELESEPLCPSDLVVIASKSHPRINGSITPAQLAQEGQVVLQLHPGKLANSEKVSLRTDVKVRRLCKVGGVGTITRIVGSTDLIGVVPRIYATAVADRYDLQVIELPVKLGRQEFFMFWHRRHQNDPAHLWLRDQIRHSIPSEIRTEDDQTLSS